MGVGSKKGSDAANRYRLKTDEISILNQFRDLKEKAYGKTEEDGEDLILTSNIAKSVDDLISEYKIDINLWECIDFQAGGWTTPIKTKFNLEKGRSVQLPTIIENRKCTAKFKKKTSIIDYDLFKKELIEDIKRKSRPVSKFHFEEGSGNMLEINIPDLHLGKMGWGEETGSGNYDTKIAVERHNRAIEFILNECSHKKIDKILFVVGNDLFNSNTSKPYSQTSNGTPQADDLRWQKTFKIGRNLIIDNAERLSTIAPVEIKMIYGNHAYEKEFYLGEVLDARFSNNENITVDNSPTHRKYFRWGECLLGFTHGNRKDEGKRIENLMEYEKPLDWADTKFREWHLGDIHHYLHYQKVSCEDNGGTIFEHLPTLMFNDEWEAKKGYNSQKGAHAFIWNKERGKVLRINYNG